MSFSYNKLYCKHNSFLIWDTFIFLRAGNKVDSSGQYVFHTVANHYNVVFIYFPCFSEYKPSRVSSDIWLLAQCFQSIPLLQNSSQFLSLQSWKRILCCLNLRIPIQSFPENQPIVRTQSKKSPAIIMSSLSQ